MSPEDPESDARRKRKLWMLLALLVVFLCTIGIQVARFTGDAGAGGVLETPVTTVAEPKPGRLAGAGRSAREESGRSEIVGPSLEQRRHRLRRQRLLRIRRLVIRRRACHARRAGDAGLHDQRQRAPSPAAGSAGPGDPDRLQQPQPGQRRQRSRRHARHEPDDHDFLRDRVAADRIPAPRPTSRSHRSIRSPTRSTSRSGRARSLRSSPARTCRRSGWSTARTRCRATAAATRTPARTPRSTSPSWGHPDVPAPDAPGRSQAPTEGDRRWSPLGRRARVTAAVRRAARPGWSRANALPRRRLGGRRGRRRGTA